MESSSALLGCAAISNKPAGLKDCFSCDFINGESHNSGMGSTFQLQSCFAGDFCGLHSRNVYIVKSAAEVNGPEPSKSDSQAQPFI